MAYVRVPEWSPDQVADWLRGLDDAVCHYAHAFLNNDIDGRRLVMLVSDDLHNLNIWKLGHQEIILEAVEHLCQSYFHLDIENLQWLALRLSCKARSLYNELPALLIVTGDEDDEQQQQKKRIQDRVTTKTLSAVSDIITSVKLMVSWLERPPFDGQDQYGKLRAIMLQLSVELAMNAQRDKFAEEPNMVIRNVCSKLDTMCTDLIQDSRDPAILQPASLDVATIRKKPNEELGMHIEALFSGSHVVGRIKYQSPASSGGRVERGDEIVQVNYQTVVGWTLKKLVVAMKENVTEVVLTLKKRPKLSTPFGRHFLFVPKWTSPKLQHRPTAASVKKGSYKSKQCKDSSLFPPPPVVIQTQTLVVVNDGFEGTAAEDDDDDDSAFMSEVDSRSSGADVHLAVPKMQVALQRRATVTGASPTASRPPVTIDQLWHNAKRDVVNRSHSYDVTGGIVHHASADVASRGLPDVPHKQIAIVPLPPSPRTPSSNSSQVGLRKTLYDELGKDFRGKVSASTATGSGTEALMYALPKCVAGFEGRRVSSTVRLDRNITQNSECTRTSELERKSETCFTQKQEGTEVSAFAGVPSSACKIADERADNTTDASSLTSYQVVVVGGVAQKCPVPYNKEQKRSPLPSPVVRHKMKRWDFASRRISCKDLGQGDCEGWLYRGFLRRSSLRTGHKWHKRWCVLKANGLFVYVDNEALKAECFVHLVGFNISPAPECKSRKYAFKVCHTGTDFYFASDSQTDMSKWMNKMGLAAISFDCTSVSATDKISYPAIQGFLSAESVIYSESEEEIEESKRRFAKENIDECSRSGSPSSVCSSSSHPSFADSLFPSSTDRCHSLESVSSKESFVQCDDLAEQAHETCNKSLIHPSVLSCDRNRGTSSNLQSCEKINFSSQVGGGAMGTNRELKKSLPDVTHSEVASSVAGSASEPSVKMSLAFEMNLDSSPLPQWEMDGIRRTATLPPPLSSSHGARPVPSSDSSKSLTLSALKLFGSPKFVKKFAGHYHGRHDSKSPAKGRSVWFGDVANGASCATPSVVSSSGAQSALDKRILGSPRLARAFLRAIHHKRAALVPDKDDSCDVNVGTASRVSSETMISSASRLDYRVLQSVRISSIPSYPDGTEQADSSLTSESSSVASSCVSDASVDVPRTSLKPAMGVSMIGKQRRASTQSEGRTSQSSYLGLLHQPLFTSMATQGTQTDNG